MSSKTLRSLRQQALALDDKDRADLAYDLLDTLDPGPASEVDQAWLDEAERRVTDLDAGTIRSAPIDGVLEDIKKRLL